MNETLDTVLEFLHATGYESVTETATSRGAGPFSTGGYVSNG
jgi:hypothetical protein